jgi:hypothetical protein
MGGLGSTAAGCCLCPSIGERSKGKIAGGSARAAELIALVVSLLRVEEEPCGERDCQLLLVVAL